MTTLFDPILTYKIEGLLNPIHLKTILLGLLCISFLSRKTQGRIDWIR